MRLFIGIEIPEELRHLLLNLQTELKQSGIKGSWKYVENLHLTLEFLGETDPEKIPVLTGILKKAAKDKHIFRLNIQGLGAFPSIHKPRILWTSVGGDLNTLHTIHDEIHTGLINAGFKTEERNFTPHITIASKLKDYDFEFSGKDPGIIGEFVVKEIILFDSKEQLGKRVYTDLERVSLE